MVRIERTPGSQNLDNGVVDTNSSDDVKVYVLNREELAEAIQSTLAIAGCTLEELQNEARSGDFSSESNSRTWFCISPFVDEAF